MISIDWQAFTPMSLVGGMVIGIASVILLLGNGRIAGISGIVGRLLKPSSSEAWQWLFVLGLLVSPFIYGLFATLPKVEVTSSVPVLIIAGLLVGFGTRLGSGCTSGHGICGNARLSPRSIVATLTFMAAGFVTVFVFRHVLSLI